MCTSLDSITVPQPHFIPGYTGYCPQYMFRAGNTYGCCTHKVLVDPMINHSEYLVLADRTTDNYQVYRPSQKDIDIVKSRFRQGNTIYQHPMIAGYEGFVPRLHNQFGQTYSIEATEALAEFEKGQHKNREALHHVKKIGAAQSGKWDPKSLQDRTLIKTEYKLPLLSVRPEQVAVIRDKKVIEPCLEPPFHSQTPYFMNCENPQKYIIKGSGVHVPFGYAKFGATNDFMTNSALCDFTSNYRKKMSTEWAPMWKDNGRGLERCEKMAEERFQTLRYSQILKFVHFTIKVKGTFQTFLMPDFYISRQLSQFIYQQTEMSTAVQDSFQRLQSIKSRFSGHSNYGYTHGQGEKTPKTNISTNEFLSVFRQKQATEWVPRCILEHPKPLEITCYAIHHLHVGHIPNYGGHIPGAQFRYGRTFGKDTIDAKRWLRGDKRVN